MKTSNYSTNMNVCDSNGDFRPLHDVLSELNESWDNQSHFVQQGWECPRCRTVYSPFVSECTRCGRSNYWTTDRETKPCNSGYTITCGSGTAYFPFGAGDYNWRMDDGRN